MKSVGRYLRLALGIPTGEDGGVRDNRRSVAQELPEETKEYGLHMMLAILTWLLKTRE